MNESVVQGAVIVTAGATVAVAIFAALTWKVYQQIKGVMEDSAESQLRVMRESFESDFRPVVHVQARRSSTRGQWRAHLTLQNVGKGVAHRVRYRTRSAANGKPGEWSDPDTVLGDLIPAAEPISTRSMDIDGREADFDVSYQDLYGNEFVTEVRGRLMRYRRVELSSADGNR